MAEETDIRPPIPLSLADRPVSGGLALPWVNVELAGGGVDFRAAHQARFERCWRDGVCQSCGNLIGGPSAVLLCGPRQLLSGRFDEPPVCPPCALYVSRACPMVSGRMERYADRPRVSAGHRGESCSEPGCGCGGWVPSDPGRRDYGGDPAHPWYACWIPPLGYQATGHLVISRCSDLGCEHERLIVNGAFTMGQPLKVILVSEPGAGRGWRPLTRAEATDHAEIWVSRLGLEVPERFPGHLPEAGL